MFMGKKELILLQVNLLRSKWLRAKVLMILKIAFTRDGTETLGKDSVTVYTVESDIYVKLQFCECLSLK